MGGGKSRVSRGERWRREMERDWGGEEQKKIKNSFVERNLKPYLGCLTSGELDLEGEGKEKKKERKKTSHINARKKGGFFPLFATI